MEVAGAFLGVLSLACFHQLCNKVPSFFGLLFHSHTWRFEMLLPQTFFVARVLLLLTKSLSCVCRCYAGVCS